MKGKGSDLYVPNITLQSMTEPFMVWSSLVRAADLKLIMVYMFVPIMFGSLYCIYVYIFMFILSSVFFSFFWNHNQDLQFAYHDEQ